MWYWSYKCRFFKKKEIRCQAQQEFFGIVIHTLGNANSTLPLFLNLRYPWKQKTRDGLKVQQNNLISSVSHITTVGPVTATLRLYSNICFSERNKKSQPQTEWVCATESAFDCRFPSHIHLNIIGFSPCSPYPFFQGWLLEARNIFVLFHTRSPTQ